MQDSSHRPQQATVTCSRCKKEATVPFQPTPGRPVYCRECYARPARMRPTRSQDKPNAHPPKRMLNMGRKGHFVYDAMRAIENDGEIEDEEQQRTFVEMVFARGSRQNTDAATEFLEEKRQEGLISEQEAARLREVVDRYSVKR